MKFETNKTVLAISIALALSACGGGGGASVSGSQVNTTPKTNHLSTINNDNIATATADEVKAHNQSLKANHVSQIDTAAKAAVQSARGSGAAVVISDWGLNRDAYAGLNSPNVDTDMDTPDGVVPVRESAAYNHGSQMTKVVVDTSPEARVRHYANVNNNIGVYQQAMGGVSTYRTLANSSNVKTNTIVISNSYSTSTITDGGERGYKYVADQLAYVLTQSTNGHTGLFVIATGNEGKDNADDFTRMASTNDTLKSVYIAVTGLDSNGNQNYNDCGQAKDYCIAAPSYHVLAQNKYGTVTTYGTSPATAYVSAEAANIASNYDWANAAQIKQMIFTNAIAKGNANEYGVGVYSTNARGGYGRFDTVTELNVNGIKDTYYMTNNISGNGSLIKRGQDTLALTGNNTYTGSTRVAEGALLLNGKNVSSITVDNGAKLIIGDNAANGITTGSITNNGTLSSQNLADVTVNGNLTTTGVINKYVGSTINVTGVAYLGGVLNVTGVANGYATKAGTRETLITAQNVNGQFNAVNVTASSLFNTTVSTDNKGVYANIARNTVGTAVHAEGFTSTTVAKAAGTAETVLTGIDNKINNGQELTSAEKSYIAQFTNAQSVAASIALSNSAGTHSRSQALSAQHNLERASTLADDTLNNRGFWIDYTHNTPKYRANEVSTSAKENGVTMGFTHNFGSQSVGVSVSANNTDYNERIGTVNQSATAKTHGVDIAYTVQGQGGMPNVFAIAGVDSIKMSTNGKGTQYRLGTGITRTFSIGDILVAPTFGLFYTESDLKNIDINSLTEAEKLVYKELVAKLGVRAQMAIGENTTVFGKASVRHDLIHKAHSNSNIAGTQVVETLNERKEMQGNVSVGMNYRVNNFTFGAEVGYQQSQTFRNVKATIGASYKF